MQTYWFDVVVAEEITDELTEHLFEAGCDDKAIALGSPDGYARKFAIKRQRDLEERIRAPGLQYGTGY